MSPDDIDSLSESPEALADWILATHREDLLRGLRRARARYPESLTTREPEEHLNAVLHRCVASINVRNELIDLLHGDCDPGSFLSGVAFNVGREEAKKNKPLGFQLNAADQIPAEDPEEKEAEASRVKERDLRVREAMARLPSGMRRIIHETLKEARSIDGIARRTNRTPQEVKRLFREGLDLLRDYLEP